MKEGTWYGSRESSNVHPDIGEVLLSEKEIAARVAELGRRITADYRGKILDVVVILKGAVMFMADLVRHVDLDLRIGFMAVSSYGDSTVSSGTVRIVKDLQKSIEGRDVLIVEDIVDTGLTMAHLLELLGTRHPASMKVCTLLSKPSCRKVDVRIDYCGFEVPDKFVVGYGLDYRQMYRHLPYIGVLKPSVYERNE